LAFSDVNALATTDNPPSSAYVAGSTGGATNRKFRVGEVGGWCALEEVVVSSAVASINFVLTPYAPDFEDFRFVINKLQPATDNVDLLVQFSTNGGSGYDAGAADYEWLTLGGNASALSHGLSSGDIGIQLHNNSSVGSATNEYYIGSVALLSPFDTGARTHLLVEEGQYYGTATNLIGVYGGGGRRQTVQDTDAIRFLFRSGNIASGKITMLGRRKVQ
jgi:hypothetical protein